MVFVIRKEGSSEFQKHGQCLISDVHRRNLYSEEDVFAVVGLEMLLLEPETVTCTIT